MKKTIYFILVLYSVLFLLLLLCRGQRSVRLVCRDRAEYSWSPRSMRPSRPQSMQRRIRTRCLCRKEPIMRTSSTRGKGIVVTSRYVSTKDWQTVVNTIIDGSTATDKDNASTVQLMNAEDSTTVLDGFTITGGTGTRWVFGSNTPQEGGGIILGYSSATIRNNIIRNNVTRTSAGVITGGGGGISSMYGNPTICNNVIVFESLGICRWNRAQLFARKGQEQHHLSQRDHGPVRRRRNDDLAGTAEWRYRGEQHDRE